MADPTRKEIKKAVLDYVIACLVTSNDHFIQVGGHEEERGRVEAEFLTRFHNDGTIEMVEDADDEPLKLKLIVTMEE